ncbi:VOC family protein [Pelagibacterium luteolum]|uniref:Glyoxylase I family protein n=1 Tax=Pelagibacterium luteolum TaxID=440168 RepID=A0A1G7RWJ4_9HYPH|nr:VOC family protein [Pelagibacterium luteolum]SDG15044.1 glyoxylase I family protein [Pelagibacterium luteolum]
MSGRLLGFEHAGIAVSDLDASIGFYCELLGLDLVLRKQMPRGSGELAFLETGNGQLELICPSPRVETPAPRLPDSSAGIRHLTFRFDDIDAVFARLVGAGVAVIEAPREAYNKEIVARVAFVADPDGIVIELAQR